MNDFQIEQIINKLIEKNKTIAFAESIYGNMTFKTLFQDSKNLEKIDKGWIIANNKLSLKTLLNIPDAIFQKYSLISRELNIEIAIALQKITNADIIIAILGNLSNNIIADKEPGVLYFTLISGDRNIDNYSLKIAPDSLKDAYDLVSKQILGELQKKINNEKI
ncbi:MAG: CinA family protein [Mycoplasmoidaceae bacterium]